jgi:hypothetical protein
VDVAIAPVNDAPELELVSSNLSSTSGDTVSIEAQFSDIEGDTLTLTWEQGSGPAVVQPEQSDGAYSFKAPEVSQSTEVIINALVSDGSVTTEQTITITISPAALPTDDATANRSSGGSMTPGVLVIFGLFAGFVRKKYQRLRDLDT